MPSGFKIEEAMRLFFEAKNNKIEYEIIICGLELAIHLGVQTLKL